LKISTNHTFVILFNMSLCLYVKYFISLIDIFSIDRSDPQYLQHTQDVLVYPCLKSMHSFCISLHHDYLSSMFYTPYISITHFVRYHRRILTGQFQILDWVLCLISLSTISVSCFTSF